MVKATSMRQETFQTKVQGIPCAELGNDGGFGQGERVAERDEGGTHHK